jgi:hypothetical protein
MRLNIFSVMAALTLGLSASYAGSGSPRTKDPADSGLRVVDILSVAREVAASSLNWGDVTVVPRKDRELRAFISAVLPGSPFPHNCTFSALVTDPAAVDSLLQKTDSEAFDKLQSLLAGVPVEAKALQSALPGKLCSGRFRKVVYILPHSAIKIILYERHPEPSRDLKILARELGYYPVFTRVEMTQLGPDKKYKNRQDLFEKRFRNCGFDIVSEESTIVDEVLAKTSRGAARLLRFELSAFDVRERVLGFGKKGQACGPEHRQVAYVFSDDRVLILNWNGR